MRRIGVFVCLAVWCLVALPCVIAGDLSNAEALDEQRRIQQFIDEQKVEAGRRTAWEHQRAAAELSAAAQNAELQLRIHTPEAAYPQGMPISVIVEVRNTSSSAISLASSLRLDGGDLRCLVRRPDKRWCRYGSVVQSVAMGTGQLLEIQPGGSFVSEELLPCANTVQAVFNMAGSYEIVATYRVGRGSDRYRSNALRVEIIAGEKEAAATEVLCTRKAGMFFRRATNDPKVVAEFEEYLLQDPDERFVPYLRLALGEYRIRRQDYPRAETELKAAVNSLGDFPLRKRAKYGLAMVYEYEGKSQDALSLLDEVTAGGMNSHLVLRANAMRGRLIRKLSGAGRDK